MDQMLVVVSSYSNRKDFFCIIPLLEYLKLKDLKFENLCESITCLVNIQKIRMVIVKINLLNVVKRIFELMEPIYSDIGQIQII
jgi:hypothetical protein